MIHDDESRGATEDSRVGLIGKTLGRYRISAELGRGGMATVYRATDPQLGREVAIKVMHGAFAGRGDIEMRFRREAQAVAAIRHDAIVSIFDFAPPTGGEPGYIVTEIVEGPTLRALLDRHGGRLLPEMAAVIVARVAGALGAAHARGIVHRDVKPDNVMIDVQPGAVRVLLTDFGVAHMADADTMTATGAVLGSPTYMSPEQARGQEIGPASDVFSLGVMLYQLATGRPPFAGRDPLTVIAAILRGELLRPSQVDAHVGGELESIIMRCLKRLPAERYPEAGAVAAALGELSQAEGLADSSEALRRFFEEGDAFTAELKARAAAAAFAEARRHARRGALGRALGEINRVLAYQPAHAGAKALLGSVTRRRRLGTLGVGISIVAVMAGIGYGAHKRWLGRAAPPPPVPSAPAAAGDVGARGESAGAGPPASHAAPAPGQGASAGGDRPLAAAPPSAKRRPSPAARARASTAGGHEAEPPPAPAAATVQPAAAVDDAAQAPPASTPMISAATAARLVLRASQGFCSPSMDDHPPSIHPSYDQVPPGLHRIYCTLPLPLPGGTKVLVTGYELRPGTRPNLVIVPGPDGRPTLGRVE